MTLQWRTPRRPLPCWPDCASSISRLIAGPAATTVLGDFGADVVKVEPPVVGDAYRYFTHVPPNPHVDGFNYTWQLENRNKRSIELDLKSPTPEQCSSGWSRGPTCW